MGRDSRCPKPWCCECRVLSAALLHWADDRFVCEDCFWAWGYEAYLPHLAPKRS
jgi:hypothetical protein